MRDTFHHERLYRGAKSLTQLEQVRLVMCGAGAVGSHVVDNLVRQGVRHIRIIDFDRIESYNVGTQTYAESDVGAFKVEALQADIFRVANIELEAKRQQLTERNVAKLLKGADLVVDGFDNHAARALVTEHCRTVARPCLHVGLNADYAEIMWNETYRVPHDLNKEGVDVCDYPLARNLIQFAVALASETIIRFVLTGEQKDYSFTLRDLHINQESRAVQFYDTKKKMTKIFCF